MDLVVIEAATIDLAQVTEAIRQVSHRLIDLVQTTPDPATRVPTTPAWTVREAMAHVVTVVPRYSAGPEGRGKWVALTLPSRFHNP